MMELTQNTLSIGIFVATFLAALVLRKQLPRFFRLLDRREANAPLTISQQALIRACLISLLCYGCFTGLHNLAVSIQYNTIAEWGQHLLVVGWVISMGVLSHRHLKDIGNWRSFTSVGILGVGLYAELVVLHKVPDPWAIPAYVRSLSASSRALLHFSLSLVAAAFVYGVIGSLVLQWIQRSRNKIDDHLYRLFRGPFTLTIVLMGTINAMDTLGWHTIWRDAFESLLWSLGILYWLKGFWGGTGEWLSHLYVKADPADNRARAIPIFNLLLKALIVLAGIYSLLTAWGVDPTATIASAGVIGIAVAYASQDTLSSLLAGVAILSDGPYRLGDFLILEDGRSGKVTHIGFRSTRLITREQIEIVIPNAYMANALITNLTGGPHRHARTEIPVGVAYGSNTDQVREILFEVGKQLEHVIQNDSEMPILVHFVGMGDSSLDFMLRVWIHDPTHLFAVQDQANTLIYKALGANGIEIPYPKRDVYVHNIEASSS